MNASLGLTPVNTLALIHMVHMSVCVGKDSP